MTSLKDGKYKVQGSSGEQWLFEFENGFGASVVRGPYSYGGSQDCEFVQASHRDELCYATPITSDVVGYQDEEGVTGLLNSIQALKAKSRCTHRSKEA